MIKPLLFSNKYLPMRKLNFVFFLFVLWSQPIVAQTNYAVKLAETIMHTYKDSMVVMKYASHLEQDKQIPLGQTAEQAQKTRPAVWNYEMGVVLIGFEKLAQITGDKKYTDYSKKIVDHFITSDGEIRTYIAEEYNLRTARCRSRGGAGSFGRSMSSSWPVARMRALGSGGTGNGVDRLAVRIPSGRWLACTGRRRRAPRRGTRRSVRGRGRCVPSERAVSGAGGSVRSRALRRSLR